MTASKCIKCVVLGPVISEKSSNESILPRMSEIKKCVMNVDVFY